MIDFCRQHMARFKVPKRVIFCTLPKTSTGKIQKYVLREQAKIFRRHRLSRPPCRPASVDAAAGVTADHPSTKEKSNEPSDDQPG
jgi:hypothetical protein